MSFEGNCQNCAGKLRIYLTVRSDAFACKNFVLPSPQHQYSFSLWWLLMLIFLLSTSAYSPSSPDRENCSLWSSLITKNHQKYRFFPGRFLINFQVVVNTIVTTFSQEIKKVFWSIKNKKIFVSNLQNGINTNQNILHSCHQTLLEMVFLHFKTPAFISSASG